LAVFSTRRGRASDGRASPEIGSTHKTDDPVELYLTPPSRAVGRLQSSTAGHMTDHAKIPARPSLQNDVASDGYWSCGRKSGCDCQQARAKRDRFPYSYLSLPTWLSNRRLFNRPALAERPR
jgi:hypothetical protein